MVSLLANPWTRDAWNITAQGAFARQHGLTLAKAYAADAGSHIGATKPAPVDPAPKIERQTLIVNKLIGGGSVTGSGSSGDGPPN